MKRELEREFNEEVERYRRALVYLARKSEWGEFKRRAAGLFDYVEQVEAMERERRFSLIFNAILALLVLAVVVAIGINPSAVPDWPRHRQSLLMACLAASGFELYFFLNFRWYAEMRKAGLFRRREQFLRNIEQDFRSFPLSGREVRS